MRWISSARSCAARKRRDCSVGEGNFRAADGRGSEPKHFTAEARTRGDGQSEIKNQNCSSVFICVHPWYEILRFVKRECSSQASCPGLRPTASTSRSSS